MVVVLVPHFWSRIVHRAYSGLQPFTLYGCSHRKKRREQLSNEIHEEEEKLV
jgi:hypothetical protein